MKPVIFIAGLHRSGTSLLHRMLRAHDDISGFEHINPQYQNEGQHVQSVFPAARLYGGPGKFCFHPEAYLDEHSPLITQANKQTLESEWQAHWNDICAYRLEKSPPNIIRMRFLQAMFAHSMFIIITRHPLAVAYSTREWSNSPIHELVEHWALAHQCMLRDVAYLKKYTVLRYEDLIAAPQAMLNHIFRFIGVPPHENNEVVEPDTNAKYFVAWQQDCARHIILRRRVELLHALPNRFGYGLHTPYVGQELSLGQTHILRAG